MIYQVYNDALSKVHPARFYYTAPVCDICHDLYTALDEARANVIYRKQSHPSLKALSAEDKLSVALGFSDSSNSFEKRICRARDNLRKHAERTRAEQEEILAEELDGNSNVKKSLDSSKIPWESNFVYEMNALQQGSVVMAPISLEESVFLEETDAVADDFNRQTEPASDEVRTKQKEPLLEANLVHHDTSFRDYQRSMTALLNPTLGKGDGNDKIDVQGGVLQSKSHNAIKTKPHFVSSNSFSSWANLLNETKRNKGKRSKSFKGFKLRTNYKNNPEVERKRQEVINNRRLERKHEMWTKGLHDQEFKLGVYTQTSGSRKARRPKSAGNNNRPRSANITSKPAPRIIQNVNQMHHDNEYHSPFFESPPVGNSFDLETTDDIREFNDIKEVILKNRGLHSVQVKDSTKVVCGGDYKNVTISARDNDPNMFTRPNTMDKDIVEDTSSAFTSTNVFETSDSTMHIPQMHVSKSASISTTNEKSKLSGGGSESPDKQSVSKFVADLLKHSPMSPQNIDYNTMHNTPISDAVKKMVENE